MVGVGSHLEVRYKRVQPEPRDRREARDAAARNAFELGVGLVLALASCAVRTGRGEVTFWPNASGRVHGDAGEWSVDHRAGRDAGAAQDHVHQSAAHKARSASDLRHRA
jgi:hypothetical protein